MRGSMGFSLVGLSLIRICSTVAGTSSDVER